MGALAAEAMSLVDADGGAEVGNDCSHPLLEARTPRELALLVKHYRLLQVSIAGVCVTDLFVCFCTSRLRGVRRAKYQAIERLSLAFRAESRFDVVHGDVV